MSKRIYVPLSLFLLAWLFTGCNSAKLSTAEGQFRRGEYFAAAATYRKVYNKTSPRKERALRGKDSIPYGNLLSYVELRSSLCRGVSKCDQIPLSG